MSGSEWTRREFLLSPLVAGGAAMVGDAEAATTPESVDARTAEVVLTVDGRAHRLANLDVNTTLLDALRDRLQ